eukprot:4252139-Amphidinium_carterae.1
MESPLSLCAIVVSSTSACPRAQGWYPQQCRGTSRPKEPQSVAGQTQQTPPRVVHDECCSLSKGNILGAMPTACNAKEKQLRRARHATTSQK